ncbi:excisionase family DNA-binding protein [Prauserella muralis]|uniref:Helix-turn-helix domain-containing protein n=1 Tax=Prauserella muralis TaxID=588067 RepID=A0A2V4AZF7_9PSEU|nr:excisionase family DNA-binding protein [Prauserella muralis]PXY27401.1 hypothetical protein BAY60_13280 [Prauserella muralis]TWE22903.1 excisionase family DNA binding protein [Prauserella muralis]
MSEITDLLKDISARLARLERERKNPPRTAWRPREVAKQLGIPYDAALDLIHSGQLGHIRAGRHYVVPDTELQAFLGRAATTPAK